LRSSSLSGKLRARVALTVAFAAAPEHIVCCVVSLRTVSSVAEFSVLEPVPSGESVAALSVSDFFTASPCSVVDIAAQVGLVLAAELDSSGAPQYAAARILEFHRCASSACLRCSASAS
jgi:hypothetical protein